MGGTWRTSLRNRAQIQIQAATGGSFMQRLDLCIPIFWSKLGPTSKQGISLTPTLHVAAVEPSLKARPSSLKRGLSGNRKAKRLHHAAAAATQTCTGRRGDCRHVSYIDQGRTRPSSTLIVRQRRGSLVNTSKLVMRSTAERVAGERIGDCGSCTMCSLAGRPCQK